MVIAPYTYHTNAWPQLAINLDMDMDTEVKPTKTNFTVKLDGSPLSLKDFVWSTPRILLLSLYDDPEGNPVELEQIALDTDFKSSDTGALVQPWGPQTYNLES
jgi:hypothetical protein